jgi:hypothetical protein
MSIEDMLAAEKKGGVYGKSTYSGIFPVGPFMSASGYLKLARLGAINTKWGSLWGNTKVFNYYWEIQ